MRISDWSSDVCSSDLVRPHENSLATLCPRCTHSSGPSLTKAAGRRAPIGFLADDPRSEPWSPRTTKVLPIEAFIRSHNHLSAARFLSRNGAAEQTRKRSEEHKSELQSLMRISYAVFCLKKKNTT